jgi:hypothetical protein
MKPHVGYEYQVTGGRLIFRQMMVMVASIVGCGYPWHWKGAGYDQSRWYIRQSS